MRKKKTLRRKPFHANQDHAMILHMLQQFLKCILLFWKKCLIMWTTALETVRYSDLHSWRLLNFWNTASYQGQIRVRGGGLERARELIFPTSLTGDVTSGIAKDDWEWGCLPCIHLSCNSNNIFYLLTGQVFWIFHFLAFSEFKPVVFIRDIEVWIFDVYRHLQNADLKSRVV